MKISTDSAHSLNHSLSEKWFLYISLFFMLLPVLYMMAPFFVEQSEGILLSGDRALLEMATEEVPDGVYTGAYSRFGFHHPGPLYFYIRYPFYAATGENASSFYIVSLLITGLSLWGSFQIIYKVVSTNAAVLFAALISFFMFSLGWLVWASQWNPYVVIFPICLSLTAMIAFAGGSNKYLPLVVAGASFAAQTHLGVLPAMGLLVFYTLVLAFRRREIFNRYFVISLVLAFMLWIPVLVDQLSPYGTGNLSLILGFLRRTPMAGISNNSISVWCSLAALMETAPLVPLIRVSSRFLLLIQAVTAFVRSLLLFTAWLVAKRRDKNSFETRLCEVTLLLLFASVVSILGVRGLVEQYLARWISLLSPLSWLAVLLVSLKMISPKKRKILPALLLGFLGIFTVMNVNQVAGSGFSTDPRGCHSRNVEFLSQKILEENELHLSNQILITIEDNVLWVEMVGLACNLRKYGYEVAIQDEYAYMLNTPNPVFAQPLVLFLYRDGTDIGYLIEETDSPGDY